MPEEMQQDSLGTVDCIRKQDAQRTVLESVEGLEHLRIDASNVQHYLAKRVTAHKLGGSFSRKELEEAMRQLILDKRLLNDRSRYAQSY